MSTHDQFSTNVLLGVVSNLKRTGNGFLRRFFNMLSQSTAAHISFDIDEGRRLMAPFVSPNVPGRVRQARGQRVATFTPAYIKQKTPFKPSRALSRMAGEQFGGELSMQQRMDAAIAADFQDQLDYIDRRLEWMAVKALDAGGYTVEGDEYPAVALDFGRDASLVQDVPGTLWSAAGVKPMDYLDEMSDTALKLSGSVTPDVVMDVDAWKAFRENTSVQKRLELIKLDAGSLRTTEIQQEGLVLRGQADGYRIWTYQGWYIDPADDTEKPLLASGTVMGVGAIEGTQHYGAIEDHEALIAVPVFPKSWLENDPSVRWLMTQSAPLVVPKRTNACWSSRTL